MHMYMLQMHLPAVVEAEYLSVAWFVFSQDSVAEGSLSLQSMHEAATHMQDYLYQEQVFVLLHIASFTLVMYCTLAVFQVDPFLVVVMKVLANCATDLFHIFLITAWLFVVRFSPV